MKLKTFKALQGNITGIECFAQFMILLFLWQTQKFKDKSLLSLQKKGTFACTIFGKICYVPSTINCTDKSICLHACLHQHNCVGLIDKPDSYIWLKSVIWTSTNPMIQFCLWYLFAYSMKSVSKPKTPQPIFP